MVKISPSELSSKVGTYIPHHCVTKTDSSTTRPRVVFDASCRTDNGIALNQILRVGPTLQDNIFTILLRFRTHRYVLMADITKMYRQIMVDERDAKWQCILWRNSPSEPVTTYQLQTVTYGTSCAPFLAVRCLQQLAYDNISTHPIGATVTLRDFYVDNLMTGGATIEEVKAIKREVIDLLAKGGFPLRKFAANHQSIIDDVSETDKEPVINVENIAYIKTLGLKWSPATACFFFSYTPSQKRLQKASKRMILSQIASFFDPLGLINPIIVPCKIMMQELWKLRLTWDESVPLAIQTQWADICNQLTFIEKIHLPRFVCFNSSTELHAFADASTKAYGACVYAVSNADGGPHSSLIAAKSRVAPTKETTLPKLELCAALLLSELLESLVATLTINARNIYCWSDSTIALSWIQGEPSRWTTFVANRVARIQQITAGYTWRHVSSSENPADLVSRGVTVHNLINNQLWFHGPQFIQLQQQHWPSSPMKAIINMPEQRKQHHTLLVTQVEDIVAEHKFVNNYFKLLRIFAYVQRFLDKLRKLPTEPGAITTPELNDSLMLVLRYLQQQYFPQEYKALQKGRIIRVGGRITNSSLPFDAKHPIVLPRSHPFVRTIIEHLHRRHSHAGCQTLLSIVRDKFWVINARSIIRQVVHRCTLCYRNKPQLQEQLMGALPRERVEPSHPFAVTGIDYCGPFLITQRVRVHLELVPDLTTMAFIAALKRFIARRGRCHTMFSDNATNFVRANRELKEMLTSFKSQQHIAAVEGFMVEEGIIWKFIPPRSPHFGGLWEGAVKQAKFYLRRTVGTNILCFDELHTIPLIIFAFIDSKSKNLKMPYATSFKPAY
ncbi:PREDICTED: uncharacterized protein LOC108372479, partial [Rhagoletis zephyria]|uniref:uncharacterized protein LOC108372479 n=1 Tax=Rhagoletis zephyria TaxID=28612 RepID=UPI0008112472